MVLFLMVMFKPSKKMGHELTAKDFPKPKNFTSHMHQKQRDRLLNDQLEALRSNRLPAPTGL